MKPNNLALTKEYLKALIIPSSANPYPDVVTRKAGIDFKASELHLIRNMVFSLLSGQPSFEDDILLMATLTDWNLNKLAILNWPLLVELIDKRVQ
ncbi:hypothetical protein [Spirosoma endbachense]|uniref:Uncharacterized protein n=1 Tax=Spirosoma endbachense TaxID=2666025 RepID=A0A6P1W917_9BACT|nr:hypothetical protein [Spirosoma endbachense]QHW01059.1 hypothetical protein GJR95_41185 [Spirosoma endbachense]